MNTKTKHTILFTSVTDVEVATMAKLGIGVAAIVKQTGLTKTQVVYRLTKGKKAEGLPTGIGYISDWRLGRSALAKEVFKKYAPGVRDQVRKDLPPHFGPRELAIAVDTAEKTD